MTFNELLIEVQGLVGRHVTAAVMAYSITGEPGEMQLEQRPCVAFAGEVMRSREDMDREFASEGTLALLIGEDKPGGYVNVYLSDETFEDGWWVEEEGDPRYGQLTILLRGSLAIFLLPFNPPQEDADES